MLIIDEPNTGANSNPLLACADPMGVCTVIAGATPAVIYNGSPGHPNVFPGRVSANQVTFQSIPIDPPAGIAKRSVDVSVRSPDNSAPANGWAIHQCASIGLQRAGVLRFAETFSTALSTRSISSAPADSETSPPPSPQNVPGTIWNTESNFYAPALTSAKVNFQTAGLASSGTRIKATFQNVSAGSVIFVSTSRVVFSGGNPTLPVTGAISRLVQNEVTPFAPTSAHTVLEGIPVAELPIFNGVAAATWEILKGDPNSVETFDFAFWVLPGLTGTTTVAQSLAPTPPAFPSADGGSPSSTLPLPRFASTGVSNNAFSVTACPAAPDSILLQSPANGAAQVSLTPALTWSQSANATSYDVYFGTANNPPLVANVLTTTYHPGALNPGSTYFWKIAAKNIIGSALSAVRSFNTVTSVPPVPAVVSVFPSSGGSSVGDVTGTYSSGLGYQDLRWVQILFAVAPDGGNQSYCFVHYDVQGNGFWLYGDGGFFVGPIAPETSSNLLQNSLCAVNTAQSSAAGSGSTLSVMVNLIFKAAGARNIYMRAQSPAGNDTGWVQQGSWTTLAAPLWTMWVSPDSGSGSQQTFTVTYPLFPGYTGAAFGWEQFLIATASNGGSDPFCFVRYDRAGNGLWLYSSDTGFFVGPVAPGASSSLLNSSACQVDTASASVTPALGTLSLALPITLKTPMTGPKFLFQRTLDVLNRDTGWVQSGTWTRP